MKYLLSVIVGAVLGTSLSVVYAQVVESESRVLSFKSASSTAVVALSPEEGLAAGYDVQLRILHELETLNYQMTLLRMKI